MIAIHYLVLVHLGIEGRIRNGVLYPFRSVVTGIDDNITGEAHERYPV